MISEHERILYDENVLSTSRLFDHLPTLERNLFELASDHHLSAGVYYTLTISANIDEKRNTK